MGWYNAKTYCESNGAYLATFETLESASWFTDLINTNLGDYIILYYVKRKQRMNWISDDPDKTYYYIYVLLSKLTMTEIQLTDIIQSRPVIQHSYR